MNVAFSSLIILLLLLPGLIFTVAFINTDHKPVTYVPLTHKAILSIFMTCALHALWLWVAHFLHYPIDFHTLLILGSGTMNSEYMQAVNKITLTSTINFFFYFFTLYAFSFLLAKGIRWFISYSKLDRKYEFLRLESKWHYLFGGHDWAEGDPEGVVIAATTELAGIGYLYLGLLESFHFDHDGKFDYLILSSASRRCIADDKQLFDETGEQDSRFYPIDGDYIVLKYAEIKTLNIGYLRIEDV